MDSSIIVFSVVASKYNTQHEEREKRKQEVNQGEGEGGLASISGTFYFLYTTGGTGDCIRWSLVRVLLVSGGWFLKLRFIPPMLSYVFSHHVTNRLSIFEVHCTFLDIIQGKPFQTELYH